MWLCGFVASSLKSPLERPGLSGEMEGRWVPSDPGGPAPLHLTALLSSYHKENENPNSFNPLLGYLCKSQLKAMIK